MKKILAIDDNEINLELLHQIVKIYYPEFQFIRTTSGIEGIELARQELPEIILLDILMPEINGYEVCAVIKNDPTTQNIPIIMISALGVDANERTKGLNAGADSFVSKPFSRDEITAQLNVALRIKKVEDLLRKRNESLEHFIKDQTSNYQQNEERFLQISEHALEFYWEVDASGIFTYISPVVEKTLGINQNEIIGEKNCADLFQSNDPAFGKSDGVPCRMTTSCKDYETELHLEDRSVWLSISCIPIADEGSEFKGLRGVCYDITKRKLAEIKLNQNLEQIREYQKKLKNMNIELTLAEEKERRRIAENLHDGLGQTLSLAFIKLSSISTANFSDGEKKLWEEASGLLNDAISESRSLTYDLSPPILYELGLVPAFKWKLGQIEESLGIKTKIVGEEQLIEVQKEFEIFLYRMVSELLTNVIKHANATEIKLMIRENEHDYLITVQDNGIGFNTARVNTKLNINGGFGLLSITERLESMKGRLTLVSENGTKATIAIPTEKNIYDLEHALK